MTEPSSTPTNSSTASDLRAYDLGYHQYRSLVAIVDPAPHDPSGPWRITDTPGGPARTYTATHVETGTRLKGPFASFKPWDGPLPALPEPPPINVGATVAVQPGHKIDPDDIYVVIRQDTGDTYRIAKLGGEPGNRDRRGLSRQWLTVLDLTSQLVLARHGAAAAHATAEHATWQFARWLQEQRRAIGGDVDLADLHREWTEGRP